MKVSVYVPDELMDELHVVEPDVKLSAFLQEAIRARVSSQTVRPYAVVSGAAASARRNASHQILQQLRDAYSAGYQVGTEFARRLPWEAFVDLNDSGWVVEDWRLWMDDNEFRVTVRTDGWEEATYLGFNDLLDTAVEEADIGVWNLTAGNDWVLDGIPGEGFRDAIRDSWTGTLDLAEPSTTTYAAAGEADQADEESSGAET